MRKQRGESDFLVGFFLAQLIVILIFVIGGCFADFDPDPEDDLRDAITELNDYQEWLVNTTNENSKEELDKIAIVRAELNRMIAVCDDAKKTKLRFRGTVVANDK